MPVACLRMVQCFLFFHLLDVLKQTSKFTDLCLQSKLEIMWPVNSDSY